MYVNNHVQKNKRGFGASFSEDSAPLLISLGIGVTTGQKKKKPSILNAVRKDIPGVTSGTLRELRYLRGGRPNLSSSQQAARVNKLVKISKEKILSANKCPFSCPKGKLAKAELEIHPSRAIIVKRWCALESPRVLT